MGMRFGLLGITPDQANALRANPALAADLTAVAQEDAQNANRKTLLSRLPVEKLQEAETRYQAMESSSQFQEYRKGMELARSMLSQLGPIESALDLDKSWHILHYAFTGDIAPVGSVGDALMSGEDVGVDMGYGPPRLYDPERTQTFANFLKHQTLEELQSRLIYPAMMAAGVYGLPMGHGSEDEFGNDVRREFASCFPQLRDYVVAMASKGNGLLMWLT